MQQNTRTGKSRILALLYSQRKQSQQSLEKKQLVLQQIDSFQQFGSQLLEKARVQVYKKHIRKEEIGVNLDSQNSIIDLKKLEVRNISQDTLFLQNLKHKDLSYKRQNITCSSQKRVHLNHSQQNLNKSQQNFLYKQRDTNQNKIIERYGTQMTTKPVLPQLMQQSKILINLFDDTSFTFGRNLSEPKISNLRDVNLKDIFPNKVCQARKQMTKKNKGFQSITLC